MSGQVLVALCASHINNNSRLKYFLSMIESWRGQTVNCQLYISLSYDMNEVPKSLLFESLPLYMRWFTDQYTRPTSATVRALQIASRRACRISSGCVCNFHRRRWHSAPGQGEDFQPMPSSVQVGDIVCVFPYVRATN